MIICGKGFVITPECDDRLRSFASCRLIQKFPVGLCVLDFVKQLFVVIGLCHANMRTLFRSCLNCCHNTGRYSWWLSGRVRLYLNFILCLTWGVTQGRDWLLTLKLLQGACSSQMSMKSLDQAQYVSSRSLKAWQTDQGAFFKSLLNASWLKCV